MFPKPTTLHHRPSPHLPRRAATTPARQMGVDKRHRRDRRVDMARRARLAPDDRAAVGDRDAQLPQRRRAPIDAGVGEHDGWPGGRWPPQLLEKHARRPPSREGPHNRGGWPSSIERRVCSRMVCATHGPVLRRARRPCAILVSCPLRRRVNRCWSRVGENRVDPNVPLTSQAAATPALAETRSARTQAPTTDRARPSCRHHISSATLRSASLLPTPFPSCPLFPTSRAFEHETPKPSCKYRAATHPTSSKRLASLMGMLLRNARLIEFVYTFTLGSP